MSPRRRKRKNSIKWDELCSQWRKKEALPTKQKGGKCSVKHLSFLSLSFAWLTVGKERKNLLFGSWAFAEFLFFSEKKTILFASEKKKSVRQLVGKHETNSPNYYLTFITPNGQVASSSAGKSSEKRKNQFVTPELKLEIFFDTANRRTRCSGKWSKCKKNVARVLHTSRVTA